MQEYTIVLSVILVIICLAILVWACANLAAKFTEFMHSLPLLIMILVFILFPPTLIVFIIGWFILSLKKKKAIEAQQSLLKETNAATLSDVSGIWRLDTDGAMLTIDLDNKDKYFIINEQKIPVQINSIDTENNIVSLNVNTNEKVIIWKIQQIFREDGRFTLNMVLHDGVQDGLSFVRNLN